MKNIYISLLLSSALCMTNCTDFLDVKPVGRLIPSKVEDLENLLNNNRTIDYHYMDNNRGSFYAYLGDNVRVSENQESYLFTNSYVNIERYAAYRYYHPYNNPNLVQYTWEWGIYRAVSIFNTVIDEVAGLKSQNSDLGKIITAQAKAGRAWSYMVGGLGYGPMYDPDGSNDHKVLPYRIESSPVEPNPALATTKEIMDLVEKDLLEAKDAPSHVSNPTRASLTAVEALLAQLYMYKRDWPKMKQFAESAWSKALAAHGGSVDKLIYDYNDFSYKPDPIASPSPGTDVEMSLELTGTDNLINQTNNREILFYRVSPTVGTSGAATVYPSVEFLNLFDQNTDQRYRLFALRGLGYSVTVAGVKHDDGVQRYYVRQSKMMGNQGLSYPELLLMKAEANARTNSLSAALADLNLLRKYRYGASVANLSNGGALNQDQLLHEILNERRRELPMYSFQRVLDIKRLALDTGKPWAKTKIEHVVGGKTYSADVNSKYFTLQINNPTIKLNPSWGLTPDEKPYLPVQK